MLDHKNITWGLEIKPSMGKIQSSISSMARKNFEQAVHFNKYVHLSISK